MGGISILMILAMMGAVTLAIIVAITLFIAATIISIVFAAQRKQRREQGKKLGALIALPIALYTVSVPLLIVFSAAIFIPFFQSSTTITYEDCSQAIISHDFEQLEIVLMRPNYSCHPKDPLHIKASSILHLSMKTKIAYVHCSKTPGQTISQST